jgi:branched-chain amino acid transport system permease protein
LAVFRVTAEKMVRFIKRFGGWPEIASLVVCALAAAAPWLTTNLFLYSVIDQSLIAVCGALSVYVMLRMNLLNFAVPAFMGIGGYTTAILALRGATNIAVLAGASFLLPLLTAIPLGILVLRLRGVYFVLITYVFSEILQLVLFETPSLTGGSDGLAGVPAATLFGATFSSNAAVVMVAAGVALIATIITILLCRSVGEEFGAIAGNEALAQSLGLVVWRYKALGFCVSAGVAGLAGLSLVLMLLTAHPSSFGPLSSIDYIAYAIVGGCNSILGPAVGSSLLVYASNIFGSQGEYSSGLFGLLIILSVLLARGGLMESGERLASRWRAVYHNGKPGYSRSSDAV